MSLMNKLTQLAKSDKGKELIDKAQAIANDPKTREKIDTAREKVEAQVDAAKHKLAEKRGEKDAAPTAEAGSASATDPLKTPVPPAPATSPPTEANYGGDEGPKAA
jgi:hypothetical protein